MTRAALLVAGASLGLALLAAAGRAAETAAESAAPAPAVKPAEAPAEAPAEKPATAPRDEYARIPGTRVSLKKPKGMILSRSVSGLQTTDGRLTISVSEVRRPFSEASQSYTPEVLATAGVRVLARADVEIAGQPGVIVYAAQGKEIALWLAAFGDDQETVVVRGMAPVVSAKKVTDRVHDILVTARWEREETVSPFQGLDYELAGKLPLQFAVRIGSDLYFTRDGAVRTDPDELELVVGQRGRKIPKEERDEYCKTTLEGTPGVGLTSDAQQADVRIDGLDGCEMMAAGRERKSSTEILVYQLVLFDADGHYLFRGRVGWERQFRFSGVLLETVRAFKRKS